MISLSSKEDILDENEFNTIISDTLTGASTTNKDLDDNIVG